MPNVTAFLEDRIVAGGPLEAVTHEVERKHGREDMALVRAYDDETGKVVDLDYWDAAASAPLPPAPARPRGRPKLGVVPREVTLLPRHWDWLAAQPGGASAALRRLVEEARKAPAPVDPRAARDRTYSFLADMAGDRPGYEEALRALYRGERERFEALIAGWAKDVRSYALRLLDGG
jgi:hypothetical protein